MSEYTFNGKAKKRKVLFVATLPREDKKVSNVLGELETYVTDTGVSPFIVLHPSFDFTNQKGKDILEEINKTKKLPQPTNHPWKDMSRRDFFAIQCANIVIYDTDINATQYLSAAAVFDKPIIGYSEVFNPVPPYYSGHVDTIVKPDTSVIVNQIRMTLKRPKRKPAIKTPAQLLKEKAVPLYKTDDNPELKTKFMDTVAAFAKAHNLSSEDLQNVTMQSFLNSSLEKAQKAHKAQEGKAK
jgi:hypothetical protein